mmetsp:Transcript_2479/g.4928  ORF Transcript_2479/g.4928 Transcript_2479/m.4928 type:complete len:335 (-) Transcript_2479:72-1076(-)
MVMLARSWRRSAEYEFTTCFPAAGASAGTGNPHRPNSSSKSICTRAMLSLRLDSALAAFAVSTARHRFIRWFMEAWTLSTAGCPRLCLNPSNSQAFSASRTCRRSKRKRDKSWAESEGPERGRPAWHCAILRSNCSIFSSPCRSVAEGPAGFAGLGSCSAGASAGCAPASSGSSKPLGVSDSWYCKSWAADRTVRSTATLLAAPALPANPVHQASRACENLACTWASTRSFSFLKLNKTTSAALASSRRWSRSRAAWRSCRLSCTDCGVPGPSGGGFAGTTTGARLTSTSRLWTPSISASRAASSSAFCSRRAATVSRSRHWCVESTARQRLST